jgi:hypothetical protein
MVPFSDAVYNIPDTLLLVDVVLVSASALMVFCVIRAVPVLPVYIIPVNAMSVEIAVYVLAVLMLRIIFCLMMGDDELLNNIPAILAIDPVAVDV